MKEGDLADNLTDADADDDDKEKRTPSKFLEDDDKLDMTQAILNRRTLPKYNFLNYMYDLFVIKLCCCCCKRTTCFRSSMHKHKRNSHVKNKLSDELDLIKVVQQLRILQFITTALLRRN